MLPIWLLKLTLHLSKKCWGSKFFVRVCLRYQLKLLLWKLLLDPKFRVPTWPRSERCQSACTRSVCSFDYRAQMRYAQAKSAVTRIKDECTGRLPEIDGNIHSFFSFLPFYFLLFAFYLHWVCRVRLFQCVSAADFAKVKGRIADKHFRLSAGTKFPEKLLSI